MTMALVHTQTLLSPVVLDSGRRRIRKREGAIEVVLLPYVVFFLLLLLGLHPRVRRCLTVFSDGVS